MASWLHVSPRNSTPCRSSPVMQICTRAATSIHGTSPPCLVVENGTNDTMNMWWEQNRLGICSCYYWQRPTVCCFVPEAGTRTVRSQSCPFQFRIQHWNFVQRGEMLSITEKTFFSSPLWQNLIDHFYWYKQETIFVNYHPVCENDD